MKLHTQQFGDPTSPALLVVHGLYGSARNWGAISKRLSDVFHVCAVDLRNHGESPWSDDHSYAAMALDLGEVIDDLGQPVRVLGHSMGGKAAMVLALRRPDLVERLIVADIAPVSYQHDQRQHIETMRAMDLATFNRRSELTAALVAEGASPALAAFFAQSFDAESHSWRLNLDALERNMDDILSFPDMSEQFDGPTLFLSGALSDYVLPDHRPAIKALFPEARFARLPNAGHWLHAEDPRGVEDTVRVFMG